MTFARQLRHARADKTQAEAARISRVSKRTYEKWEAGESAPPFDAEAITRERVLARLTINAANRTEKL